MAAEKVRPILWCGNRLELLDQRRLPGRLAYLTCHGAAEVARAIRRMVVRGAPAISIAAAYGVVLSVQRRNTPGNIESDIRRLADSRPTAVNLGWAMARMRAVLADCPPSSRFPVALATALDIHRRDVEQNQRMGTEGAQLLSPGSGVLTHCNTGALATGGYGTALGVIKSAWREGLLRQVYATETRPWLQGARLTAWELAREGIPATLLVDSAVAALFSRGTVDWVIVGADRVAANGDVVNKIGTLGIARLAREYGVKCMVVAPDSTVDMTLGSGEEVPLEQRDANEIRKWGAQFLTPPEQPVWNPVFDVTPAHLVDVLVTNRGVLPRPDSPGMTRMFA